MTSGYLLDTHVVLWWLSDPERLTSAARLVIADGTNMVYVSAAAAWEMGIKRALGRLDYPANLEEVLETNGIEVLPVKLRHGLGVADLPLHHQDPFDRLQIVQAQLEDLVLVTRDGAFAKYDVSVLDA